MTFTKNRLKQQGKHNKRFALILYERKENMDNTGFIKLHRKLLDNPIVCKDSDYLAVWIYLLLNATHKEIPAIFKKQKILLQPGQLITGRVSIANKLKVSESKVRRIINELKIDNFGARIRIISELKNEQDYNELLTLEEQDKLFNELMNS